MKSCKRFVAVGIASAGLSSACLPTSALAQSADSVVGQELDEIVVTATRREKPLLEVAASITTQNVTEFRGVAGVLVRRGAGDGEEFPFISIRVAGRTASGTRHAELALLNQA